MFVSPNQSRRVTVGRVLVALIGVTGALAAVAYATSAPPARDPGGARPHVAGAGAALLTVNARPGASRPPRPRITRHPAKSTLSTRASFRFVHPQADVAFQCKLDQAGWKRCGPRVTYRGLAVGSHRFLVRAEGGGRRGLPALYAWVQGQPQSFSIAADLSGLSQLFPGAPAVALPLVLTNPNSAPISVVALRVAVTADPARCPSAENLELTQSSASIRTPLKIPAGGSVRLPANGVSAPAIALRNLPVNQDSCQGAHFPLAFSGEATG
jgi:hypothetical protein